MKSSACEHKFYKLLCSDSEKSFACCAQRWHGFKNERIMNYVRSRVNMRCLSSLGLNHSYFACRKTFGQELCVSSDRLLTFHMGKKKYSPQRETQKPTPDALVELYDAIWPHFALQQSPFRSENLLQLQNAYCTMQFAVVRTSLRPLNHHKEFAFGIVEKNTNHKMILCVREREEQNESEISKVENCRDTYCGIDKCSSTRALHIWPQNKYS